MEHYRHRQVGWLGIAMTCVVFGAPYVLLLQSGLLALPATIFLVHVFILLSFSTLTVVITDDSLDAKLGIGLVRRHIRWADVLSYRVVRNPWYAGYGLRRYDNSELLNVAGRLAVEFELTGGKRLRIGSDEPETMLRLLAPLVVGGEASNAMNSAQALLRTRWPIVGRVAVLLFGVAIFVFAVGNRRTPTVHITADHLAVGSGMFKTELPLSSISDVEMVNALPMVRRKDYGYQLGSVLRGRFTLDSWGTGSVFADVSHGPFIVVHTADTFVVVGLPDHAALTRLYDELHH